MVAVSPAAMAARPAETSKPGKPGAVPVPTDVRATYAAHWVRASPIGREILTQRDGPSGRSYSIRECTCPVGRYRLLGDAETLEQTLQRPNAELKLTELVVDKGTGRGSISYHVCACACSVTADALPR